MSEDKGVALSVHATQTPITGEEFAPPVTAESQIGVMRMSKPIGFDAHHLASTGETAMTITSGGRADPNHIPSVFSKTHRATSPEDATKWERRETANMLNTLDNSDVRTNELVCDKSYCVGNGQSDGGGSLHEPQQALQRNQVRRLTPLECTRLQGFPDGWVDIGDWEDTKGRLHKEADAPKYKALGNSIAIPFWEWMARRMVAVLKRDGVEHPTMCSLFDGIGGFPLSFQRAGCEPVWASEIEEFPIAVTKRHFPEPSKPVSGEGRSTTRQASEKGYKAPLRAREAVLALNDQGGGDGD